MKALAVVLATGLVAGCTISDTCATIDAAHEAFLAEVELSPDAFSAAQRRNERLGYTAAKLACSSYNQRNPAVE